MNDYVKYDIFYKNIIFVVLSLGILKHFFNYKVRHKKVNDSSLAMWITINFNTFYKLSIRNNRLGGIVDYDPTRSCTSINTLNHPILTNLMLEGLYNGMSYLYQFTLICLIFEGLWCEMSYLVRFAFIDIVFERLWAKISLINGRTHQLQYLSNK